MSQRGLMSTRDTNDNAADGEEKYTADNVETTPTEELQKPRDRLTFPIAITAFASAFGTSFPHGWNSGVLNAPSQLIRNFLNDSVTERADEPPSKALIDILWAITVSVYLLGGSAGALSAGWWANRFGRKRALLIMNAFCVVAAIFFAFCNIANSLEMLILGRAIVGFGCGAGSGLVPMYLTEIAPVHIRGAMGTLHQFALTCGILLSQVAGLRQIMGNERAWPILLAFTAIPSLVSTAILPWFPDSPRYLYAVRKDEKLAKEAVRRFRARDNVDDAMEEMRLDLIEQEKEEKWTFKQLFTADYLRLQVALVSCLNMAQQLSGINIVFYYSADVFEISGIPKDSVQYAVVATGAINVAITAISIPFMEKFGRRPLLLGGMMLMVFAASVITVALTLQNTIQWLSYVSIICIILFVVGFAIGLGPIPQFSGAELFTQGPRPAAMSLGGMLNWFCNFLIGLIFPSLQSALKSFSFIPFIGIVVGFGMFFWFKLPETKNKTYEEINRIFMKKHPLDLEMASPVEMEDLVPQNGKMKEALG